MMRFTLLILLAPIVSIGQRIENMYPEHADSLHLKSITIYSGEGSEKKLIRRNTYTSGGKMNSWKTVYYYDTIARTMHDTMTWRDDSTSVYWSLLAERNADSTVSRSWRKGVYQYRVATTWLNGNIANRDSSISDTLNYYSEMDKYSTRLDYAMISRARYTYDSLGRKTGRDYRDSMLVGRQHWLMEHNGYSIEYHDKFALETYYEYVDGRKSVKYCSYVFNDKKSDSTIHYDKKGRIDHITVSRFDSTGRCVSFEQYNRRGKPESSYSIVYTPERRTEFHYVKGDDPAGVRTSYYDSKGLCVREEFISKDGTRTELYTFEYTFY